MATGFFGADVEQLRTLARELSAQSESLREVGSRVNAMVASLPWRGPDAERFRSEWEQRVRPQLLRAAEALGQASETTQRQASQQESVSSAGSSSGASGGTGGSVGGGSLEYSEGGPRYQIGVLPGEQHPWLDAIDDAVDTTIPGTPWTLGQIGQLLPFSGDVLEVQGYVDRLGRGEVPFFEAVDTVGGLLRDSHTPVGYLGGAAIGVWNTAAQEAMKADFSQQQLQTNADFIRTNPLEALDAAGDAIVSFFPDLVKNFL